jgi:hypothetical protein
VEILITDVTEMSGANFCVAGWDTTNTRMVRPLPNGGNWPQALVAKHQIEPGAILTAAPTGPANGTFPHLTEDTPIDASSIAVERSSPQWIGSGAPAVSPSLSFAFNNNLRWKKIFRGVHQGVYVPTNTKCRSLAALAIDKSDIKFVQPFGKLLAILNDGNAQYQLSVSSHLYKKGWRQGGVEKATSLHPKRDRVHVRVGLARDFESQSGRCYLMVNGIL